MIRRLVLDVLKPHDPGIVSLTQGITDKLEVDGVTATLLEIDEDVRTLRLVIEGEALVFEEIEDVISDLGASIHSVDQVSCGERVVADEPIEQR